MGAPFGGTFLGSYLMWLKPSMTRRSRKRKLLSSARAVDMFQRALCGRPKRPGQNGELRRLALRGVTIHVPNARAATFA